MDRKTIAAGIRALALTVTTVTMSLFAVSCNDDTSYAELLDKENSSVNRFLADHIVINDIPEDSIFETGPDAPYYRIDKDGNLYMQVLYAGTDTEENEVKDDDLIYFRFTRYNLEEYKDGELGEGSGNQTDMTMSNTFFRYNNFIIPTSASWGYGIQAPLEFLPVDCQVNIVIKSQMGLTEETVQVIPFLYNLRYYRPSN